MSKARIALLTAAVAASTMLAAPPASAHTNVVIAAFQIAPGGYVNGYGVVANQEINEGPASDGTITWVNLDPVTHTLTGTCIARPTTGTPRCKLAGDVGGPTKFTVILAPGASVQLDDLPLGTYIYGDAAWPTMQARVRVTSGH